MSSNRKRLQENINNAKILIQLLNPIKSFWFLLFVVLSRSSNVNFFLALTMKVLIRWRAQVHHVLEREDKKKTIYGHVSVVLASPCLLEEFREPCQTSEFLWALDLEPFPFFTHIQQHIQQTNVSTG